MINNRIVITAVMLLIGSVICGKWKIGTITNKTKDLVLESAWYGKQTKTSITHLTALLPQAMPVSDPSLAKPVVFNSLVSDRSNGCCLIVAKKGDISHKISFDAFPSLAIKQNRKKTQLKCVGVTDKKNSCDHKNFDYCARAFIEVYSKDNQWESVFCTSQGYNLKPEQTYAIFDIIVA